MWSSANGRVSALCQECLSSFRSWLLAISKSLGLHFLTPRIKPIFFFIANVNQNCWFHSNLKLVPCRFSRTFFFFSITLVLTLKKQPLFNAAFKTDCKNQLHEFPENCGNWYIIFQNWTNTLEKQNPFKKNFLRRHANIIKALIITSKFSVLIACVSRGKTLNSTEGKQTSYMKFSHGLEKKIFNLFPERINPLHLSF